MKPFHFIGLFLMTQALYFAIEIGKGAPHRDLGEVIALTFFFGGGLLYRQP